MSNPDDPYNQYPAHPGDSGAIPPYQGQNQPTSGYQQGYGSYQQPNQGSYDSYQQPGYPVSQYPQQSYGYGGYPQPVGTNGMAIASLICSIGGFACGIGFIVGIVLGVIALGQIKTTGQEGRGMAIAGVVIGGVAVALVAIFFIVVVLFGAFANN